MKNLLNSKVLIIYVLMISMLGACANAKKSAKDLPKVVEVVSDWCADCVKMTPVMDEAKVKFKNKITFENLNIKSKEAKSYEQYYKGKNVKPPIYLLFDKDGKNLASYSGAGDKDQVLQLFGYLADPQAALKAQEAQKAAIDKKSKASIPKLDIDHKNLPTFVFYYADWCPYCRKMTPVLEKFEKEFAGKVFFSKLNVDAPENRAFIAKYRLKQGGIPYMQFFDKKGSFQSEAIGAQPEATLRAAFKKYLGV